VRHLLLVRHGAAAATSTAGDRERPLTREGRTAVQGLRAHLSVSEPPPDLVLCSPARRTRETLELLEPAWVPKPESIVEEALYLADAASLLQCLRDIESETGSVMVVGHNPGLEVLARILAGAGDQALRGGFPTSAVVIFEISAPWSELAPASAKLLRLLVTKAEA
jgi:phosphohistidine phosphatase